MLDQPQKLQSVVMNQQQQQQQQAGNLQFMDASSYGASANFGGPPMGGAQQGYYQPAASGYDYGGQIGGAVHFENEPPLLEELGIDFDKIVSKTISVLNPAQRVTRHMMYSTSIHTGQEEADSDMAGPILVALALGAAMLLRGKVHFGYIYGIGLFGCCSLWLVMTLMSHKGVDIYQTSSILVRRRACTCAVFFARAALRSDLRPLGAATRSRARSLVTRGSFVTRTHCRDIACCRWCCWRFFRRFWQPRGT